MERGILSTWEWANEDSEESAEQRPVVLGPWLDDAWIIEDGLNEGDRLIVNGTIGLVPGATLSIVRLTQTTAVERDE